MARVILIFLVVNLFVLINRADSKNQGRKVLLDEVDRRLQLLNKPAVKSIKTDYGDIIDCVDIYKQPAFDHPVLKNHIIQMEPSFEISTEKSKATKTLSSRSSTPPTRVFQTWQKNGRCPDGTIPIRRFTREDLLRTDSLEEYGKKPRHVSPHLTKDSTFAKHTPFSSSNNSYGQYQVDPLDNRSYARLFSVGPNYIGASAAINVWTPRVESNEDYTTAQIWVQAGPPGDDFESIEFGWIVNPKLYGHKEITYFVYWTRNGYKSTGCFDLTCSGFIQTNPRAYFGGPIRPLSVVGGAQYEIPIGLSKDPVGNWWVTEKVDGFQTVWGYWPAELFAYLDHGATFTAWGGEVYSPNVKKTPHTKTAMGSGAFAAANWGRACYVRDIKIIDDSIQLKYPQQVSIQAEEDGCYTADNFPTADEPWFFFGGLGKNPRCI